MISLPGFKKPQAPDANGAHQNSSARSASAGNELAPRATLEALVERAERAAEALKSFDSTAERAERFAALERRIVELESQLAQTEDAAKELDAIRSGFAGQSAAQERAGADIAAASTEAARITATMGELAGKIDRVLQLTEHMERVDEVSASLTSMHNDAAAVRSQVRDLNENVARLRTVHDDVTRAHKHATIRLDGIDQRHQTTANKMDVLE